MCVYGGVVKERRKEYKAMFGAKLFGAFWDDER